MYKAPCAGAFRPGVSCRRWKGSWLFRVHGEIPVGHSTFVCRARRAQLSERARVSLVCTVTIEAEIRVADVVQPKTFRKFYLYLTLN